VPEVILDTQEWVEQAGDPSTPAAGRLMLYAKSKKFYQKDSDGMVTDLAQAGGGAGGGSNSFTFFMS
jgi:hypothetical protein